MKTEELENRIKKLEEYKKRTQSEKDKNAEFLKERIIGFVPYWESYTIGCFDIPEDVIGIFSGQYVKFEKINLNEKDQTKKTK